MRLKRISLEGSEDPTGDPRLNALLPSLVRALDALSEEQRDHPLSTFVPSDPEEVAAALLEIEARGLAQGLSFCEWGSGSGVMTLLAAALGYDAVGIEIEARLVGRSEALADELELPARFLDGTFVPREHQELLDRVTDFNWLADGGADAYERLRMDPSDFDLIYAYPWPGEEEILFELFTRVAGPGALLLTYHGIEGLALHRAIG